MPFTIFLFFTGAVTFVGAINDQIVARWSPEKVEQVIKITQDERAGLVAEEDVEPAPIDYQKIPDDFCVTIHPCPGRAEGKNP
jgi:hypothetical protein